MTSTDRTPPTREQLRTREFADFATSAQRQLDTEREDLEATVAQHRRMAAETTGGMTKEELRDAIGDLSSSGYAPPVRGVAKQQLIDDYAGRFAAASDAHQQLKRMRHQVATERRVVESAQEALQQADEQRNHLADALTDASRAERELPRRLRTALIALGKARTAEWFLLSVASGTDPAEATAEIGKHLVGLIFAELPTAIGNGRVDGGNVDWVTELLAAREALRMLTPLLPDELQRYLLHR